MVPLHNGILLSHKEEQIMSFSATWMQLEITIQNEISEKEKDKYRMTPLKCGTTNMT